MSRIVEWFWRFLPDKCEMPKCCRKGIRGNENIVHGLLMCDYCHALYLAIQDIE
jgi:hypothetical protein